MEERKYAKYFEIVELIEKVLQPKSKVDYTTISPDELVEKFDKEVEESGYYFKVENLANARTVIERYQKYNYERKSVFVGYYDKRMPEFDQNNYSIQNNLSKMKNNVIGILRGNIDLIRPNEDFLTLGSVEELKPLMTKDKIKNYVEEVLYSTWENKDTIRLEEYALATDILQHFGMSTGDSFDTGENALYNVASAISRMEFGSRDFHGELSSEGFYDSSTTNRGRHPEVLKETVKKITEYIYILLQHSLEKTEYRERERKMAEERAKKTTPTETPSTFVDVDFKVRPKTQQIKEDDLDLFEDEPEAKTTPEPEVPNDELEAIKAKYEKRRKLLEENQKLEEAQVRDKIKLAELQRAMEERAKRIKENEEVIKKTL